MNEESIINALSQVKEVFDKYEIEFWLDSGVLLGAIRDKKLIPWDHDVDLGAWYKDLDKIISACKELKKKGFIIDPLVCEQGEEAITINADRNREYPIVIELHKLENGMLIRKNLHDPECNKKIKARRLFRRGLKYLIWVLSRPNFIGDNPPLVPKIVHIFLLKISLTLPAKIIEYSNKILNKVIKGLGYKWRKEIIPNKYFKCFSTIKFYGMEFRIPHPVEEYLEFRYGKDWRIPRKNWSFSRDDGVFKYLKKQ